MRAQEENRAPCKIFSRTYSSGMVDDAPKGKGRPPGRRYGVQVNVYMGEASLERLDEARGVTPRSEAARQALAEWAERQLRKQRRDKP